MKKDLKRLSLTVAAIALIGALAGPVSALNRSDLQQKYLVLEENAKKPDSLPITSLLRVYIQAPPEETIFVALGFEESMSAALQGIAAQTKTRIALY